MRSIKTLCILTEILTLALVLPLSGAFAGTTGKITGQIIDSEGAPLPLEAASSARACSAVRGAFLVPVSACCVMRPTCGEEDPACVPQSKARSPATMPLTVGESGTAWRGGNRGMSLVPWRPRESLRKDEIWPTCGGPLGV